MSWRKSSVLVIFFNSSKSGCIAIIKIIGHHSLRYRITIHIIQLKRNSRKNYLVITRKLKIFPTRHKYFDICILSRNNKIIFSFFREKKILCNNVIDISLSLLSKHDAITRTIYQRYIAITRSNIKYYLKDKSMITLSRDINLFHKFFS